MGFLDCRASAGFLTRYERELREPLVRRQGSQVSMSVVRHTAQQVACHSVNNSKGKRRSIPPWKTKKRLLLGRKVMTNLDSIFKSRDITLPIKIRIVKAMVFPVVIYGC